MSDNIPIHYAEVKATLLTLVEASRSFSEEVSRKLEEFNTRLIALEVLVDMLFTGPDEPEEDEEQKEH